LKFRGKKKKPGGGPGGGAPAAKGWGRLPGGQGENIPAGGRETSGARLVTAQTFGEMGGPGAPDRAAFVWVFKKQAVIWGGGCSPKELGPAGGR